MTRKARRGIIKKARIVRGGIGGADGEEDAMTNGGKPTIPTQNKPTDESAFHRTAILAMAALTLVAGLIIYKSDTSAGTTDLSGRLNVVMPTSVTSVPPPATVPPPVNGAATGWIQMNVPCAVAGESQSPIDGQGDSLILILCADKTMYYTVLGPQDDTPNSAKPARIQWSEHGEQKNY